MRTPPLRSLFARTDLPARFPLCLILLVALILRVGVAFFSGLDWYTTDSYTYLKMADAILADSPQSYLPNGYPLLIAATKWLLPERAVPSALIWINVLLSTAVVGLTYRLTRILHPAPAVALLAAAVLALYPHQLVYLHYLLTEVSTEFWIVLGSVSLCGGRFVSAGAALAVAALFRGSLSPVPAIVLGILWIRSDPGHLGRRFGAGVAVVLAVYGVLLAGGVVGPTRNLAGNLHAAVSQRSTDFVWDDVPEPTPEQIDHPLRAYLTFAVEQPDEFAMQRLSALWETWGPYPQDTPRAIWEQLLIGLRFPLLLLAAFGFARHRSRLEYQLLAVPIGVLTAVHFAFFSAARFSYVVMPLVISMAIVALFPTPVPAGNSADDSVTPKGQPDRLL